MIKEYHVSENLYNYATNVTGYRIQWTTGNAYADENAIMSDYIPVTTNTYWVSTSSVIVGYDSSKTYVGVYRGDLQSWEKRMAGDVTTFPITSESGVSYIRLLTYSDGQLPLSETTMLNTGSTALPYEPYGNTWNTKSYCKATTGSKTYSNFPIVVRSREQGISSWNMKGNEQHTGTASPTNPIEINGTGDRTENHFNAEKVVAGRMDNGVIGYASDTSNVQYSNNVLSFTISKAFRGVTSDLIPIDDVMCISYTLSSGMIKKVAWYASDKSFISQTEHSSQTYPTGMVLTPIENVKYFRISFEPNAAGDYTITNIMLNTGSTALPYEPYGYKIPISANGTALTPVYLTEQLVKVNNTADSLDSNGAVTRHIKKIVFNGSETGWTIESGTTYVLSIADQLPTSYENAICSHYVLADSYNNLLNTNNTFAVSRRPAFFIHDNTLTTVDALKTYLATQYANGTPVTVYYVIETAVTEQVTVPTIPTTSSPTTIDVNTSVKPSEMSLTYDGYKICKKQKYQNDAWT